MKATLKIAKMKTYVNINIQKGPQCGSLNIEIFKAECGTLNVEIIKEILIVFFLIVLWPAVFV